jgi:hypothetical protein
MPRRHDAAGKQDVADLQAAQAALSGRSETSRGASSLDGPPEPISRLRRFARRKWGAPLVVELYGFWLLWHLEGVEGLRRGGLSEKSIDRRIELFRRAFGVHPDEFNMPGVALHAQKYRDTVHAPTR